MALGQAFLKDFFAVRLARSPPLKVLHAQLQCQLGPRGRPGRGQFPAVLGLVLAGPVLKALDEGLREGSGCDVIVEISNIRSCQRHFLRSAINAFSSEREFEMNSGTPH